MITSASSALLDQLVAAEALKQLNLRSVFPKIAVVDYNEGAFERGDSVTIRRAKRRIAQDIDPRAGSATYYEGEFISGTLSLEKLFVDGFPVYSNDAPVVVERYLKDTGIQLADALVQANDPYMYGKYRTWNIPTSGPVALGINAPIAIVASVSNSTGQLSTMSNTVVRYTETLFDIANVPYEDRFMVLSASAKGDFIGDGVIVSNLNLPANLRIQDSDYIGQGLGMGMFTQRYSFQITGSNAVSGQIGATQLDTHATNTATLAIASVAANTAFTYADYSTGDTVYCGAVDFTLTVTTALTNVAVGQIVRIGSSSNTTAFGVVLRINNTTATAPVVTLVPYTPSGIVLLPQQITPGTDLFSVPTINSVNVASHREALLMANRKLREPSPNSGVTAISLVDPNSNLVFQAMTGQYQIASFSETRSYSMLTGSQLSDLRKAALVLSL